MQLDNGYGPIFKIQIHNEVETYIDIIDSNWSKLVPSSPPKFNPLSCLWQKQMTLLTERKLKFAKK